MAAIRFRVLPRNQDQVSKDKQQRNFNKLLMVLLFGFPGMSVFLLFLLYPISESLPLSLFKWNGLGALTSDNFVGAGNYTSLLANTVFQNSLLHSLLLMVLSLVIQLPLALGLALIVGRGELRGRRFFRGVLFVPFVFSEIISAI